MALFVGEEEGAGEGRTVTAECKEWRVLSVLWQEAGDGLSQLLLVSKLDKSSSHSQQLVPGKATSQILGEFFFLVSLFSSMQNSICSAGTIVDTSAKTGSQISIPNTA